MKEKLSLLEVCKLPDVQLHSKTAFFKSIVSRQTPEVAQMKDQIASLSYTVKIIGVQGEEVGITSKRIPMKIKKKDDAIIKTDYIPIKNYLPHKSFYAHPLISIRREKDPSEKSIQEPFFPLQSKGAIKVFDQTQKATLFKTRARSMANMRPFNKKAKHLNQNIDQIGKITGIPQINGLKKKSFSGLLKECNAFTSEKINPLFHEENALFKKIQKIKGIYPEVNFNQNQMRIERYDPDTRQSHSSQSSLLHHYRNQI